MNVQDLQVIHGYVQALPPQQGRDDAAKVAVVTDDGQIYHVRHKGQGVGLLANINAHVEVTGCVSPLAPIDDDGEPGNIVSVKSFRLTDGFDDPWYDDSVR